MGRFEPNEQRRLDRLKLAKYIEDAQPGSRCGYLDIQRATGVEMNARGKSLFRLEVERAGRRTLLIRDFGYEFISPSTGVERAMVDVKGVARKISRAQTTVEIIATQFLDKMSPADQTKIRTLQASRATLELVKALRRT